MKNIAFLEYTFIFNPDQAWKNGYSFEKDLGDFFAANGFEANILQTLGGTGRRVIYVTPIDTLTQQAITTTQNLNNVKGPVGKHLDKFITKSVAATMPKENK